MEGVPVHREEAEWRRQEKRPPGERWKGIDRNRLRYHAADVLSWWRRDGCPGPDKGAAANANPAEAQIEAELAVEEDPKKRRELRQKLKKSEGV